MTTAKRHTSKNGEVCMTSTINTKIILIIFFATIIHKKKYILNYYLNGHDIKDTPYFIRNILSIDF
jgi:hypothetical protein